ncbi:MAG: hypothetical protein D8M59_01960 [Planctomycetes bacterium]|nr:hypothetical protein [Planctomycetota bacterium]
MQDAAQPSVGDALPGWKDEITALPRDNQWSLIPPTDRPALRQAATADAETLTALLTSDDPDDIGLAIFIADQQADIESLLSANHLLENESLTLPFALPLAQPNAYEAQAQTVSEYLTAVYHHWFGVDVDGSLPRFASLIGEVENPDHLIGPWLVTLVRAESDEKRLTALKADIDRLPDHVRWAVITVGWCDSVYTQSEAVQALSDTDLNVLADIREGKPLLPSEPLFRASDSYRKALYRRALMLTQP